MADGVRGKRSRQVPSGFPLMQGTLLPTWPWGEGQSWEEEGVSGAGDPGPVLAVPLYATTYTRPPGLLQESGRCQKPGLGAGERMSLFFKGITGCPVSPEERTSQEWASQGLN